MRLNTTCTSKVWMLEMKKIIEILLFHIIGISFSCLTRDGMSAGNSEISADHSMVSVDCHFPHRLITIHVPISS